MKLEDLTLYTLTDVAMFVLATTIVLAPWIPFFVQTYYYNKKLENNDKTD